MNPHGFFQNSSPSSSSPETSSSSKARDATDGIPSESSNPLPSNIPSNKDESKEKEATDSVDPSSPKDSSRLLLLREFISLYMLSPID